MRENADQNNSEYGHFLRGDSVQPRHRIFVKGCGILSFAKNMGKNIGKSLIYKYGQKPLDHPKQSPIDTLKTALKKSNSKTTTN